MNSQFKKYTVKILLFLKSGFKLLILNPLKKVKNFILVDLKRTAVNFIRHDGELTICALSFYLLISFIPASLIFISILSFFFKSDGSVYMYLDQIKHQLPNIDIARITNAIDNIVKSKKYLTYIWFPFLFWWGSFIFDIIERGLEKAFQIEESRKFWKAKIRHFVIMFGIGLFFLALSIFSNFVTILKNSSIILYITKNLSAIPILQNILISIGKIPFLLSSGTMIVANMLLFFIIYKFVPPKKLDIRSLLKGAFFASLFYEIFKTWFSYYISEINDYTSIFGPLNSIVILIIWIWFTCFILIAGAELAYVFYEKKERSKQFDFDS